MLEYVQTIPTFWSTMTDFIKENPQYVAEDNAMDFLSTDGGRSYSLCHCEWRMSFPGAVIMTPNDSKSGAILKSPI